MMDCHCSMCGEILGILFSRSGDDVPICADPTLEGPNGRHGERCRRRQPRAPTRVDAAVAHRDAIHRLADELKVAFTVDELGRVVAEMNRVENTYEAWLRADTARLQARNYKRANQLANAATVA